MRRDEGDISAPLGDTTPLGRMERIGGDSGIVGTESFKLGFRRAESESAGREGRDGGVAATGVDASPSKISCLRIGDAEGLCASALPISSEAGL